MNENVEKRALFSTLSFALFIFSTQDKEEEQSYLCIIERNIFNLQANSF